MVKSGSKLNIFNSTCLNRFWSMFCGAWCQLPIATVHSRISRITFLHTGSCSRWRGFFFMEIRFSKISCESRGWQRKYLETLMVLCALGRFGAFEFSELSSEDKSLSVNKDRKVLASQKLKAKMIRRWCDSFVYLHVTYFAILFKKKSRTMLWLSIWH